MHPQFYLQPNHSQILHLIQFSNLCLNKLLPFCHTQSNILQLLYLPSTRNKVFPPTSSITYAIPSFPHHSHVPSKPLAPIDHQYPAPYISPQPSVPFYPIPLNTLRPLFLHLLHPILLLHHNQIHLSPRQPIIPSVKHQDALPLQSTSAPNAYHNYQSSTHPSIPPSLTPPLDSLKEKVPILCVYSEILHLPSSDIF